MMNNESNNQSWRRIQTNLQFEFGIPVYKMWLCHLSLHSIEGTQMVLRMPNTSLVDFVNTQYADRVLQIIQRELPHITDFKIIVAMTEGPHKQSDYGVAVTKPPALQPVTQDIVGYSVRQGNESHSAPIFNSIPINRNLTFDSYVAEQFNQMAFGASQSVVSGDAVMYNPLYIYGSVGMGKTHLLHAIAGGMQATHPDKRVMLLSAEKFTYEFVKALREKNAMAFKDVFALVDVLLMDDIQFIAGKQSTQAEFMNTIGALVTMGKQVVVCADKAPFDLKELNDRDQSRLGAGLVVEIKVPDYKMRRSILNHKIKSVGVHVPTDVVDYLAEHITSSIRELEASLNRLLANASLGGVPVSLTLVEECLQDLLNNNNRKVTIENIQMACCQYFEVSMGDLLSARRSRHIARPRQVAMYLAKTMTSHSLPAIGRVFGGRDHTTVMYAVKRIEELCEIDTTMEQTVRQVRRNLLG